MSYKLFKLGDIEIDCFYEDNKTYTFFMEDKFQGNTVWSVLKFTKLDGYENYIGSFNIRDSNKEDAIYTLHNLSDNLSLYKSFLWLVACLYKVSNMTLRTYNTLTSLDILSAMVLDGVINLPAHKMKYIMESSDV